MTNKLYAALALPLALLVTFITAAITTAQITQSVDCALTLQVQSGETLSLLAGRHLGSFAAYPAIVEATNAAAALDSSFTAIDNPALIRAGQKLCIPATDAVVAQPVVRPATTTAAVTPTPATRTVVTTTATATPIPAADHPLVVENMRARTYPGSEIVIEQTLAAGVNYQRYVASHLSDGFRIYGLLTVPNGTLPPTGWPIILFHHPRKSTAPPSATWPIRTASPATATSLSNPTTGATAIRKGRRAAVTPTQTIRRMC